MIIKLKEITIRDVVKGYINNDESGCVAYDGKLNIRPAYQREFVYKEKQRTISICEYIAGNFSLDHQYFHNL
ncbi:MAG: hypothetical protein LW595_06530 [Rickettsiales bacterium]|nr:hypothetical protein [Rickettsiales bacterium]